MPKQISEAQFEEHIQQYLLDDHSYVKRGASNFDKKLYIFVQQKKQARALPVCG